jgi:hypothetical protein
MEGGPNEGYEEHPDELDFPDAYSTMVHPIDLASIHSPALRHEDVPSSPHADQANKLHYLFFNPPHERVVEREVHDEDETEYDVNEESASKDKAKDESSAEKSFVPRRPSGEQRKGLVTTKSSSGSLPKAVTTAVEPASLGYELQQFNENGYVGPESLSGYLNFGSLKDDVEEQHPGLTLP